MKAVILTYDARMPLAELTVKSYMKHWPGNNFTFRIPYNGDSPKTTFNYGNKVDFVKSDKDIKSTVRILLHGIKDNEWIYWCFDDCYLHDILKREALNGAYNYIMQHDPKNIDSFRTIRFHDEKLTAENVNIGSMKFSKKQWDPYRFWFHQFVKAGVMRTAFLDNKLPENSKIGVIEKARATNGKMRHQIYVPQEDLCVLGETTRGNHLTKNCEAMLQHYGLPRPEGSGQLSGVILNGADVNKSGVSSSVRGKQYLERYL